MNNPLEQMEINLEISRSLASLRNIIQTANDRKINQRIITGLGKLVIEARDKKFEVEEVEELIAA